MTYVVPHFDPVALSFGAFAIRWYSLAYIFGFLGAWGYIQYLLSLYPKYQKPMTRLQLDDSVFWMILGVILGGRFGYVLFYNTSHFLSNPLEIFKIWQGGMAFHGGAVGVLIVCWLVSYFKGIQLRTLGDLICAATPIGLLLGRIANFVNGELYGRPTVVEWGFIFQHVDQQPRHPSQLYEAGLEGFGLLILLGLVMHIPNLRRINGLTAGIFFTLYGFIRYFIEFVREPDAHIGLLWNGLSMGQILSLPMIAFGLCVMIYSIWKRDPHHA